MVKLNLNSGYTLIRVEPGQADSYLLDLTQAVQADSELEVQVSEQAQVQIDLVGFGELHQNLKFTLNLLGLGADLSLSGAFYLTGGARVQIQILQNHVVSDGASRVKIRSALTDQAQFDYRGLIWIGPQAAQTVAHQENQNLLLSKFAQASSIPNLEVLNPDVQCGHGSAIGPIDSAQLFYLQTRGLEFVQAQRCLVESFLGGILPAQLDRIKLGLERLS